MTDSLANERMLRIYTAPHCITWRETRRLAKTIARRLPGLPIEIVDVDRTLAIDEIFAVPTFCYRGNIIFLGNPPEDELAAKVIAVDHECGDLVNPDGADLIFHAPRSNKQPTLIESRSQAREARHVMMTSYCGGLGLGGVALCSFITIASKLGVLAALDARTSMQGVTETSSVGQRPRLAWLLELTSLGPEIIIVSVLLLVFAVALRRRAATAPVVVGGLILYVGMYVQSGRMVMYTAMALGIVVLAAAYLASFRPTLSLAPT